MKDIEQRYYVHKKEMVVVMNLEGWRHYLLGTKFTVVTDNVANTYFKTQKKLTLNQARWQEYLVEFNFVWVHKLRRWNQVANALSCKDIQAYVIALSLVKTTFLDQVRDQSLLDLTYVKMKQHIVDGVVRCYYLSWDLLYAKRNQLYVPSGGGL